uniref:Uncharacterized protein n=1 Tax=Rhizophora mucronata TaxID=61149 RepID=A0A2P2NDE9_RHIMU
MKKYANATLLLVLRRPGGGFTSVMKVPPVIAETCFVAASAMEEAQISSFFHFLFGFFYFIFLFSLLLQSCNWKVTREGQQSQESVALEA